MASPAGQPWPGWQTQPPDAARRAAARPGPDVWLALAGTAVLVALFVYLAQVLLRQAVPLLADDLKHGQLLSYDGLGVALVGLAMLVCAGLVVWGAVALVGDQPAAPLAVSVLAVSLSVAVLAAHEPGWGVRAEVVALFAAAAALACAVPAGVRLAGTPVPSGVTPPGVALGAVLARAQCLLAVLLGGSILPLGRLQVRYYVAGAALVLLAVAVLLASIRLRQGRRDGAVLLGALSGLASVAAVVAVGLDARLLDVPALGPAERFGDDPLRTGQELLLVAAFLGVGALGALFAPAASRRFFVGAAVPAAAGAGPWGAPAIPGGWGAAGPSSGWSAPAPVPTGWGATPSVPAWGPPSVEAHPAPLPMPEEDPLRAWGPAAVEPALVPAAAEPSPALSPDREAFEDDATAETRLPVRRAPLSLVLPDGRAIVVDGPVVLGRRPSAPESSPAARLEELPDPGRSLSRSHVLLVPGRALDEIVVIDLESANGTWVLDGDRTSTRIPAGGRAVATPGCVLLLSDLALEVVV